MTRSIDTWVAAAIILIAVAAGACLLAHGMLPNYALQWWVPLVPAASALVVLAVVWINVREQRDTANQQRLAVDAQRLENERSQQAPQLVAPARGAVCRVELNLHSFLRAAS